MSEQTPMMRAAALLEEIERLRDVLTEAQEVRAELHRQLDQVCRERNRLREALKVKDAALAEAAVFFELEDNTAMLTIMDAALAKEV